MKNIYLLRQNFLTDYDTYDSCVVVSDSGENAVKIKPSYASEYSWPSVEHIEVIYLGELKNNDYDLGDVITESFNAG